MQLKQEERLKMMTLIMDQTIGERTTMMITSSQMDAMMAETTIDTMTGSTTNSTTSMNRVLLPDINHMLSHLLWWI